MASPRLSREEAALLLGERPAAGGVVQRVEWEDFEEYLAAEWAAGEHVSIFAPTDGGKTHLIRYGLLPLWQRYPVLWIRFKKREREATLRGWGHELKRYPESMDRLKYRARGLDSPHWSHDPEHFVLGLPGYRWSPDGKRGSRAWQQARLTAGRAIDRVYQEGHWLLVIDEVRAFTDSDEPALSLSAPLENIWQRGRPAVTLIAATQQPAKAPSSMYDQPRWVFLGRTLDIGRYQRISEIGGDTETIKAELPGLRHQEFLAVDRREGDMWILKAPAA